MATPEELSAIQSEPQEDAPAPAVNIVKQANELLKQQFSKEVTPAPPGLTQEAPRAETTIPVEVAAPETATPEVVESWNYPFKRDDVLQIPVDENGTVVEVTGEHFIDLAKTGVDLQEKYGELEADRELLQHARTIDEEVRRNPKFAELIYNFFNGGPMPSGAPQAPAQAAPELDKLLSDPDLEDRDKKLIKMVSEITRREVDPIKRDLAMYRQREMQQAQARAWQDKQREVESSISSSMKGYPIFKNPALKGMAEELIRTRAMQNREVPISRIAHEVASLCSKASTTSLQSKIANSQIRETLKTNVGSGLSPTIVKELPKGDGKDIDNGNAQRQATAFLKKSFGVR